ncbi:MAG: transglycosylase SLT domain-containing protein [Boseongicola sp.]|nr:transglycosylase SLT domain-containing protein [Boseongicola sp.]
MHRYPRYVFGTFVIVLALTGCSSEDEAQKRAEATFTTIRWDGAEGSEEWTASAFAALDDHASPLVEMVPEDIDTYCPAYPDQSEESRKVFWTNLIASLSFHESTWRPDAAGGDESWFGLLQILPATAEGYGCAAQSSEELKDGAANVACALRIMAVTVPRDGVVSRDFKGVAADWGPFHQRRKRRDIQRYTKSLPICRT